MALALTADDTRRYTPAWRWIAEHYLVRNGDTGKPTPFVMFPWTARILMDVLPETAEHLPYSLCMWATIKKSGKTAVNGAIAAYLLFERAPAGSEMYVFANSQDQSVGRVFAAVKYAAERNAALRDACEAIQGTSIRLRTGSFLAAQAAMNANVAGANPYASYWCVDQETEALTRKGFKLVVDLTTDDEVATLDPATGVMEWQHPRAVNVKPYKGPMVGFNHRRADFLVTPNHRVLGRYATHSRYTGDAVARGWWFEEASVAAEYTMGWFKGDADWVGETDYDPTMARFMGYYISEGHHRSPNTVQISQRLAVNPDTYEQIRQTVEALGYVHTCGPEGIVVRDRALADQLKLFGKAADKFIPDEIKNASPTVLAEFFDAYIQGDGWRATRASSGWQCCTVSKRLADDLMEVGLKLGYQPRLMSIRPPTGNRQAMYRLSFSRGAIAWSRAYPGKKTGSWTTVEYDGLVACPSVPHGTFYIRRNGKCVWTGNTELWGYQLENELRTWDEMTPPPTVVNSIRVVDTYAGYEGESTLLNGIEDRLRAGRRLYQNGYTLPADYLSLAEGQIQRDPSLARFLLPDDQVGDTLHYRTPLPCYVDDVGRSYGYWDEGEAARRMPWQQGELGARYYAEQERTLLPGAYRRFHLNMRAKRGGQFVPMASWDMLPACDPWKPGDRRPVVLGLDAAVKRDHMALVGVQMRGAMPEQVYAREWEPRPDARAGGERVIDPADALAELRRLKAAGMRIAAVAYDPYQLASVALQAAGEGFPMVEFSQGPPRLLADTALRDRIQTGALAHTHDPMLRGAVENADAREQGVKAGEGGRWRIVKGTGKVDSLVALSMAVHQATGGAAAKGVREELPQGMRASEMLISGPTEDVSQWDPGQEVDYGLYVGG